MSRPVRVGLAGAGWVAEHHLDAWCTMPDRAVVAAIADPLGDAARARALRYGIPAVHTSVEEMLDACELDALDVAAPREFHASLCRMAAAKGLAILCQKPLAPTLAEAESLIDELRGRARLMVHENWRFRPHYRTVREWIRDGRIGDVRSVLVTVLTSGLLPDTAGVRPALVRQPMLAGLERMLLMEVLIHHVDTLRFLLGPLTFVGAALDRNCDVIRGEDRATLLLRGAGGSAVSLVGDFMAHGYPPQAMDRVDILGTDGSIRLRDGRLTLATASATTTSDVDLAADYKASYAGAISHFLDRLADGRPFETSPEDNLETLRIVEAAYNV